MKKLLFLIPFLTVLLHATPDTLTTGSIQLLKPSTSTPDATRSAGDKLNGNFDMIAGTFTNILTKTSALADSTTTISGIANANALTLSTRTVVGIDEGVPLGGSNITAINSAGAGIAATQSGSTLTLTVTATGGVINSTKTMDITIGGGIILSTITHYGIPGTTRSPGKSSWTITDIWADCALGSTVGAFGFDILYSSTGYGGGYSKLFQRMDVSTQVKSGDVASSLIYSTISFIGAHTFLGVGVSTMPISGQNAQDCHVHFYYWEANKYSP